MNTSINIFEKEVDVVDDDAESINVRVTMKRVVEALLFSCNEPISLERIRNVTDTICPLSPKVLKDIIAELRSDYERLQMSFRVEELSGGYILTTTKRYSQYIALLHSGRRSEKLSRAATEVLAIVAYRQPLTRVNVEAIRGVDSSGILASLVDRGLVEVVGKVEAPGRPSLYATTKKFLRHFNLNNIKDLPQPESVAAVDFLKPMNNDQLSVFNEEAPQ
ncbi:MAG: SMC-Scp complex subunit ScpB [Waddliaceae bacterium]|jgi:segregation and condensation protein B|nr:SMC-Scp complex subunit ScpB [Waddliaceae bacterium]MBT3578942.1 SMC-Scp complex subunit ScpB [Waddliaceae bacterium]MBT4445499.1 SMC-Scp complex subunit ScpB [Waddliaceae bacterium]MBT6928990.1 SMC-Scp complex subunit ScpB [Waddliaceae bacterium]MBT7263988.1 SMC-Scp complex subunit ScpB [Waddliaceae bacterium]